MIKRFVFLIVLLGATTPSFADDCSGSWSIQFESHKAQAKQGSNPSVWIPATIKVSGALRNCVPHATLSPTQSNQIQLRGSGYTIETQLLDDQYRGLARTRSGYSIPLHSSGITTFWVRLANAEFAPAGHYTTRLNTQLISNHPLNDDNRMVDLQYFAEPVVAVRVPTVSEPWLSKSGNNYRVDMGEMTKGSQRNISLEVRSNSRASITVDSQNGKLVHNSIHGAYTDYQLELQGQRWSPVNRYHASLASVYSNRYTPIPFAIKVSPQPKAYAGQYSDRLTITVTAQ